MAASFVMDRLLRGLIFAYRCIVVLPMELGGAGALQRGQKHESGERDRERVMTETNSF